ncbi:hypothetical protein QOT17_015962 [Balamuthia mandrillaris]
MEGGGGGFTPKALEDVELEEKLVLMDFPTCNKEVQDHYQCKRKQLATPGRSCEKTSKHMTWYTCRCCSFFHLCYFCFSLLSFFKIINARCVLSSFCPDESQRLRQCLGGKIPQLGQSENSKPSRIPWRCQWQWRKFDRCLIRRTEQVEEDEKRAKEAEAARQDREK